jgi:acetyltransferase-like isoleucine patch superfamily enzyme
MGNLEKYKWTCMKFTGRDVYLSPKSKVGCDVRIGDNTTIYDYVEIGDHSVICNDCVIGEPLNSYYSEPGYVNPPTVIGPNSLVRSHAIIYAGCNIGSWFSTGHRVTIREGTTIGAHCSIGTLSDIQGKVKMGDYCRLHSNVHLAQTCSIGNFVFLYPYAVMTNDPYPPSEDIKGGHVGDYTQVGVHAVILPGIRVGENCLIGANSVVSRKVPDYSLAMGDPVRVVMDIRKYVAMGKGTPYPWMYRFDRGMPWQGVGFDAWMAQQAKA